MCFSANASFAASGVLTVVGAASVRENKLKRGLMYALIPLLFAAQQFIEGWQWLSVQGSEPSRLLGYGFLFFATILWPSYVPISVYLIEPQPDKKRRLGLFVFLGVIVSAYTFANLFFNPITVAAESCCHVHYGFTIPFGMAVGCAYVVATCGSMYFSSRGWVKTMSVIVFLSLLAAYLFTRATYVSVWCYFAAVISVLVLIHSRSTAGLAPASPLGKR